MNKKQRPNQLIRALLFVFLLTVCGLAKVAYFTTNIDAENQILINHKTVGGKLNPYFCQTDVMRCFCGND
ncbi:hypothetical protein ACVWYF_003325 [Hymenobacter sp. UYAg731]